MSGEAYSALAIVCRLWRGLRPFPSRPAIGALSAEAVRKGDVQEPMRERPEARLGLLAG